MSVRIFLIICWLLCYSNAMEYIHNYYLGHYEKRRSLDLLFRKSVSNSSDKGEYWMVQTLTYPLNLGPYGGKILAVHVGVQQTSNMGRMTQVLLRLLQMTYLYSPLNSRLTHGIIGSNSIELVVEADQTSYIICNYTIYGEKPFNRTARMMHPKLRLDDEL